MKIIKLEKKKKLGKQFYVLQWRGVRTPKEKKANKSYPSEKTSNPNCSGLTLITTS